MSFNDLHLARFPPYRLVNFDVTYLIIYSPLSATTPFAFSLEIQSFQIEVLRALRRGEKEIIFSLMLKEPHPSCPRE